VDPGGTIGSTAGCARRFEFFLTKAACVQMTGLGPLCQRRTLFAGRNSFTPEDEVASCLRRGKRSGIWNSASMVPQPEYLRDLVRLPSGSSDARDRCSLFLLVSWPRFFILLTGTPALNNDRTRFIAGIQFRVRCRALFDGRWCFSRHFFCAGAHAGLYLRGIRPAGLAMRSGRFSLAFFTSLAAHLLLMGLAVSGVDRRGRCFFIFLIFLVRRLRLQ